MAVTAASYSSVRRRALEYKKCIKTLQYDNMIVEGSDRRTQSIVTNITVEVCCAILLLVINNLTTSQSSSLWILVRVIAVERGLTS